MLGSFMATLLVCPPPITMAALSFYVFLRIVSPQEPWIDTLCEVFVTAVRVPFQRYPNVLPMVDGSC